MAMIPTTTRTILAAFLALGLAAGPALAQPPHARGRPHPHRSVKWRRHEPPRRVVVVAPRTRHYRGIRIARPYGRPYWGYGFYYGDDDAFRWLAFTAITLKVLDVLNEEQQRRHESAQIWASSTRIGNAIEWSEGGASGRVIPVREGVDESGHYCREFQQEIEVGGQRERAYGTACLRPDGSWEMVSP